MKNYTVEIIKFSITNEEEVLVTAKDIYSDRIFIVDITNYITGNLNYATLQDLVDCTEDNLYDLATTNKGTNPRFDGTELFDNINSLLEELKPDYEYLDSEDSEEEELERFEKFLKNW